MSELNDAIIGWRELAASERRSVDLGIATYGCIQTALHRADIYERTAKALEIQRDTGVAVCPSCMNPFKFNERGHHSCV